MQKKIIHKKILIIPLDWGLGHATRCITVVRQLQQMGCGVVIGSSGEQLMLLKKEFPHLETIQIKGYNVRYSKQKRWLPLKILMQTPKILLSIRREHKWLEKTIIEQHIDAVISDNRYGLFTGKVPCIFMTHQLRIRTPYSWLENLLQKINYSFINRYSECWIPDLEGEPNLAGKLSHSPKMPSVPVTYIGPLSRFEYRKDTSGTGYDYLFILSGPEPQRTIFEKKVLNIVAQLKGNVMILRGRPSDDEGVKSMDNCTIVNHLTTLELQRVLNESGFVISRCGYTTVMEILSLGKKSILVPTPGQTEQEYLAEHLMQQRWCYSCRQDEDLLAHIKKAKEFGFRCPLFEKDHLKPAAASFIARYLAV